MPKRITKRHRFEAEMERPVTPGQERRLWSLAVKRAPSELAEWQGATTAVEQFYAAPNAGMAAYLLGDYELASKLASESLTLADGFKDNWNYGNALHFAHTVRGLLALQPGDLETASIELLRSGETPGSPQLNSFGPTMRLARELLKAGERESVLRYLQLCRRFWKMGEPWLSIWEKKIARGALPTFFMQSAR